MSLPTDIEEFVIVGYGPMPRKAVIEAIEELQQVSSTESLMFTYLPVSSVHPKPEFFRAVKSVGASPVNTAMSALPHSCGSRKS
jgi:hypothetical protein